MTLDLSRKKTCCLLSERWMRIAVGDIFSVSYLWQGTTKRQVWVCQDCCCYRSMDSRTSWQSIARFFVSSTQSINLMLSSLSLMSTAKRHGSWQTPITRCPCGDEIYARAFHKGFKTVDSPLLQRIKICVTVQNRQVSDACKHVGCCYLLM